MISEYFRTDWAAMTVTDWWGLIITVFIFFLMIGLYTLVLRPSTKAKLEQHCDFVLKEESQTWEKHHGNK